MSLNLEPSASPVFYQATGLATLLGRAWNLVRLNFRTAMLLMLIPAVLYTAVSILFSIPSGLGTMVAAPATQILVSLGSLGGGLLLSFVAWFVALGCLCVLCRIFYSAVTQAAPLTISDSLAFLRPRLPGLFALFMGLLVLYVVFIVIDLVIGVFGFSVGLMLLGRINTSLGGYLPGMLLMIFTLLSWGAVVISLLIGVGSVQTMFCLFPLVANATASNASYGIWKTSRDSWRLLWANWPRALLFAALLMLLSIVMAMVLNLLPALWSFIEMRRVGLEPHQQVRMPLYISTVLNVWSNAIHMILMPFFFSALTLFWYDCQVRRQGLDLRLWLANLQARQAEGPSKGQASPSN